MTLVGALLRANINNAQVPITDASLAEWLGGSEVLAGVSVNEPRAYGLTAYYRGVSLLSSTIANLPLKAYKTGTRERVLQRTVLDNPNSSQTPFEFWQTMSANAITWGTGYGRKYRNKADAVTEVWSIHPSNVTLKRVKPSAAVPDGKVFEVVDMDGVKRELTSWEIFHIPYLSPHGGEGLRPLQLARQVLGVNVAAEETAARFYGRGGLISGILRTKDKLTPEQRRQFKEAWNHKVAGQGNAGDIAILDNGGEFQPVSLPPGDAQLLESRKFGVTEVARLLGVPPHLLMDLEKSTSWGTGIEQQNIGLVQYTLLGWLTAIQQRVTRELLPGGWSGGSWYAEFQVEGLLRGDSAARAQLYHSGITDGWLNRNEVRAKENLEPVDGGDEFLVPSNLTLVNVDGSYVPLSAAGMTAPDTTQGA